MMFAKALKFFAQYDSVDSVVADINRKVARLRDLAVKHDEHVKHHEAQVEHHEGQIDIHEDLAEKAEKIANKLHALVN